MKAIATRTGLSESATGAGTPPRVNVPLAALCAATSLGLLVDIAAPVTAALLAVSFVVVPGAFVVHLVQPRGPIERLIATMVVSITSWTVVAHLLLTFQWWEPRFVGAGLLAVAFVGAVTQRPLSRPRPRFSPRARVEEFIRDVGWFQIIGSLTALVLWTASLSSIDTTGFGNWGLIAAVPPTFLAAYALAIIVAVTAALAPVTSPRRVALAVAPLLMIVYATLPMLFDTIRYPWAYKHVGVIRLLDETGRLHPDVDIYNNFSGFFGLAAFTRSATGIDPTSYAAWTQLVAEALILAAVWLLVRRATDSERVAHLSVVIYLITNWVGQNYFAAQTLATLLSLAVLGLSASWFLDGATRSLPWFRSSIDRMAPSTGPRVDHSVRPARRAVILLGFLGLMMTHPLTPVATIGALAVTWMVGWLRDSKLIVGIIAISIGWGLRSYAYFATQEFDLGFGGSPTENADGNLDYSDAPAAVVAVGDLTRLFSVGVWLLAIVGAILCAWAMRRTGVLLIAACIPFGIPLVQSYGGEAIYRVYLYSLPLIAGLVAWGIVTRTPIDRRAIAPQPTVLASVICLIIGAGFLVAHFGRERINNVDPSEVAMGEYIAAEVPDPALLGQFAGTYAAASSARYPTFQVNDTYVPEIVDLVEASGRRPTGAELDKAADDLWALDAGVPYVIVSPGMIDSVSQVASLPVQSTTDAVELLTSSERFFVRHRIDDSWLIGVTP